MVCQAGLVTTYPPSVVCMTYFGVVSRSVTFVILTYEAIGTIKDPAVFWLVLGAALPIPTKVAPPMDHALTDQSLVGFLSVFLIIFILIFLVLLLLFFPVLLLIS